MIVNTIYDIDEVVLVRMQNGEEYMGYIDEIKITRNGKIYYVICHLENGEEMKPKNVRCFDYMLESIKNPKKG